MFLIPKGLFSKVYVKRLNEIETRHPRLLTTCLIDSFGKKTKKINSVARKYKFNEEICPQDLRDCFLLPLSTLLLPLSILILLLSTLLPHCLFCSSYCPLYSSQSLLCSSFCLLIPSYCPLWSSQCPFCSSYCPICSYYYPLCSSHCPFCSSHCPLSSSYCLLCFFFKLKFFRYLTLNYITFLFFKYHFDILHLHWRFQNVKCFNFFFFFAPPSVLSAPPTIYSVFF